MSQPNFTGNWTLNPEQSKLQIASPTASRFEIDHSESRFRLKRTLVYGDQSNSITLDLTIDGTEHSHAIGQVTAGIRVYWDGFAGERWTEASCAGALAVVQTKLRQCLGAG